MDGRTLGLPRPGIGRGRDLRCWEFSCFQRRGVLVHKVHDEPRRVSGIGVGVNDTPNGVLPGHAGADDGVIPPTYSWDAAWKAFDFELSTRVPRVIQRKSSLCMVLALVAFKTNR